jgi:hypothetical protein
VAAFALTSNVAALQAACDCAPGEAAILVGAGYVALLAARALLFAAGLADGVPLL